MVMIAITVGARMALRARLEPAKRSRSLGASPTLAAAVMLLPPPKPVCRLAHLLQALETARHDAIAAGPERAEALVTGLATLHAVDDALVADLAVAALLARSEEHTSELQSLRHLVCRLLLEK